MQLTIHHAFSLRFVAILKLEIGNDATKNYLTFQRLLFKDKINIML